MKITDAKLANFKDMVDNFAKKNGLDASTSSGIDKYSTEVVMSDMYRLKKYTVIWDEVVSLSEAAAAIFADAMTTFKLDKTAANPFEIKTVIFNDPATIVLWEDGTKTVVKCQSDDIYSEETGLALCIAKKALGNKSNFNNVFHKWIECDESPTVTQTVTVELDGAEFRKRLDGIIEDTIKKLIRRVPND